MFLGFGWPWSGPINDWVYLVHITCQLSYFVNHVPSYLCLSSCFVKCHEHFGGFGTLLVLLLLLLSNFLYNTWKFIHSKQLYFPDY